MPRPSPSTPVADRIAQVIRETDDLTAVVEGLFDVLSFALAQVSCPDCRRTFVASICNQLQEVADQRASDLGMPVPETCKQVH
jgi:hypothetical protein